ncbi:hypothetical protein SAMN04488574_102277 [Bacillus sp. 71mf]|nr:hypothetical protein SAMN04488574_102277 [Bacillus sp. 71mf]SFS38462.1 hypothetical protein SAMN04488145_101189 [Bacillus sp. 103mf]
MSGLVLLEPLTREESIYVREMTKEEAVAFRYLEDTFSRDLMDKVKSPLMREGLSVHIISMIRSAFYK